MNRSAWLGGVVELMQTLNDAKNVPTFVGTGKKT